MARQGVNRTASLASFFLVASTCALPSRTVVCDSSNGVAELFGNTTCDLCASESCCEAATACANEPGCAELTTCFNRCRDDPSATSTCYASCRADIPHDATLADDLLECVVGHCGEGCVLPERAATCPEGDGVVEAIGSFACEMCVRRLLCDNATSCAESEPCRARLTCMASCTGDDLNPACFDLCRDDDLVGTGDAQYFAAVAQNCREECGVGSEFDCVQNYRWPTTTQETVELSLRIMNRVNGDPFEGVTVTACANGFGACDPVGTPSSVVVDDSGIVVTSVPSVNPFDPVDEGVFSGFQGYLAITDPGGSADWLDSTLVRTRPEYRDRKADEEAPFATASLLNALFALIASMGDVALDPDRGFLLGGIVDCRGNIDFFAHDIEVTVANGDDQVRIAFINEAQTTIDFTATTTTAAGQFVGVNIPAGNPTLVFRNVRTDQVVAELAFRVEAGKASVLGVWPQSN